MIEITKSEAESLMEFIEINIFDVIRNDEYIDNIDWLMNIMSVYKKFKNAKNKEQWCPNYGASMEE